MRILKKIFVTLFFSWAPRRVERIIKMIKPEKIKKINTRRTMLDVGSGQSEHLNSPVLE